MLHTTLKMRKSFHELLLLMWILLLYQISQISCASLRNYSIESVSVVDRELSAPKNLSELIEFEDVDLPVGVENFTIVHEEVQQETTPRIITFKLKTHVLVRNSEQRNRHDSDEMSSIPVKYSSIPGEMSSPVKYSSIPGEISSRVKYSPIPGERSSIPGEINSRVKYSSIPGERSSIPGKRSSIPDEISSIPVKYSSIPANTSQSSLADIEYEDSGEYWTWNTNVRSKRMNKETHKHKFQETDDNSSEEKSLENIDAVFGSENSKENQVSNQVRRSKYARGRQFLFHPYAPYGKDVPPDEKISFHDILPVKMVKFVKSMVEDAPWEQMFIKMVRMIVDQFVDKIIEKMFEDKKGDHFKKRSLDYLETPALVLESFHTPVVRMKRSVNNKPSSDQEEEDDDDLFNYLPSKKSPQDTDEVGKKSDSERKSWLDHVLDYLFPDTKSEMDYDDESFERLKKRDTTNSQLLKKILALFMNTFEKSTGFLADAKDVLRYKMLKEFLPYLYKKRYSNSIPEVSSNAVDAMKMTHRKLSDGILKRNDVAEDIPERSSRSKRSTRAHYRKVDENRLWQSDRHRSHDHRSHDVCSLRKACNAGRLLARLPSVQEITLQLKSNGGEPHWDALIWGMKKKRCSRIFCKRERSPKGSRFSWNEDKKHDSRKDEIVKELPNTDVEDTNNNLTV